MSLLFYISLVQFLFLIASLILYFNDHDYGVMVFFASCFLGLMLCVEYAETYVIIDNDAETEWTNTYVNTNDYSKVITVRKKNFFKRDSIENYIVLPNAVFNFDSKCKVLIDKKAVGLED